MFRLLGFSWKLLSCLEAGCCRVERLFRELSNSVAEGSLMVNVNMKKLPSLLSRLSRLTGLLVSLRVCHILHGAYTIYLLRKTRIHPGA